MVQPRKHPVRFLVLFEEMAPYFWECLRDMISRYPVEILVIAKNINPVAPFCFSSEPGLQIIFRESLNEKELIEKIKSFNPDAVYVSGWIYPPYFSWIKKLSLPKVLLGFDTQWNGSLRQQLGSFYFQFFRKKYYTCAFVPSARQEKLALHLGFSREQIIKGLYCCHTRYYNSIYENVVRPRPHWPKNILFIGRWVPEKGLDVLQNAFLLWKKRYPDSPWKLIIAGKGPMRIASHPDIINKGFIQPQKMEELIARAGIFILPSRYEPYGVVLHEMAISGLPLIASHFCGATDDYLEHEKNGYLLRNISTDELLLAFEKVLHLSDQVFKNMSERSVHLGRKWLMEQWSEKVYQFLIS